VSVTTAESLDWVTFSDEDSESCDALAPCSAEAVVLVIWRPACPCAKEVSRLCAAHRDYVLAGSMVANGNFRCMSCGKFVKFVRLEPIR
jgi:hypothetical protein